MRLGPFIGKFAALAIGIYILVCGVAYFLLDSFIFYPQPEPAGEPTDERMRAVSYQSVHGDDLVAWYGEAQHGCPTFLFFHGNASHIARDPWRYDRVLNSGAGLLAVAWPGYAGSTGTPNEISLHSAASASADWLQSQRVSEGEIIIHGFSIGTGPSTKLATTGDFGALILEAPYASLERLVFSRAPLLPTALVQRTTFRSETWIGDVSEPVFIAHGTEDEVIPYENSVRLSSFANEPVEFVTFEGANHSNLVVSGLYDHIWPFLYENWSAPNGSDCFSNTPPEAELSP